MNKEYMKDKLFEILSMSAIALGVFVGTSEHAEASHDFYYGDNHGGNISTPPDGSEMSPELSEKFGIPTSVDSVNNTYYMYVLSHWFDPQQMAQFPSEVWMYGVAPYDHSSGGDTSE